MAALFFDIDGTIIEMGTNRIPESTIQGLKRAKECGHSLFINTGRTNCNLPEELEDIPFDGFCCGCGTYIRFGKEVLFQNAISAERGTELVRCLEELRISIVLEGTEDVYFQKKRYKNQEIEDFRAYTARQKNGITHTVGESGLRFDKLMLCTKDKSALKKFIAFAESDIRVLDSRTGVYECIQKDYSKATAIQWVQKYLKLKDEELYVFGDSVNDLDMFICVKHAIAMGCHDEALNMEAEYVTDRVEHDGIWKALEHYRLLEVNKSG